MSCIKGKGGGGGDSSWTLEGLSEAMDPRGREGKGCNTCTWHGQCIRYPTNARNSPPPPPLLPSAISSAPNFPDYSSLSRQRYLLHLLLHLLFHQAHACNPPMLNATFASPSIYLHSSNPPHPTPPPPPLMNHRPAPLFPSRSHFLPSYLALSRSRAPLPSPPPLVYVFIVCA